jgi:toxin CcdB
MAQFDVCRNPNRETRGTYPFLLDVQSDLIESLETRVVVPLCRHSKTGDEVIGTLTPIFDIAGNPYVMLTPELAGVTRSKMGEKVGNLSSCRDEIIAALDLLITGI